jgi:hypothetical protein
MNIIFSGILLIIKAILRGLFKYCPKRAKKITKSSAKLRLFIDLSWR